MRLAAPGRHAAVAHGPVESEQPAIHGPVDVTSRRHGGMDTSGRTPWDGKAGHSLSACSAPSLGARLGAGAGRIDAGVGSTAEEPRADS